MVCVGKTERDCCALLAEIGFFSGCVTVALKPWLLARVFLPLRSLGQSTGSWGHLDLLHCQSNDRSQSLAWQETCYTLHSSRTHFYSTFVTLLRTAPILLSLCHHKIRSLDAHSTILAIPASLLQASSNPRKITRWVAEHFHGDIFWWIWKNIEACMILVAFEQPSISHPPRNIIISLCEMLSLPFVRLWSIEGEAFTLNLKKNEWRMKGDMQLSSSWW